MEGFLCSLLFKRDCIAENIGQWNVKLSKVTFIITFIQDFLLYVTDPISDKVI